MKLTIPHQWGEARNRIIVCDPGMIDAIYYYEVIDSEHVDSYYEVWLRSGNQHNIYVEYASPELMALYERWNQA